MDASPSSSLSSSSESQQHHRQQQTASKKVRLTTVLEGETENQNTGTIPAGLRPSSLDMLPVRMLSEIGAFAAGGGSNLSGASRTTLGAVRDVHLKIDTWKKHMGFYENEAHLLLIGPSGTLKSGRVVAHITTIGGITPYSEVQ